MIIKLNQDLINKIAAGEVVERPASVIKELVENALDAKADQLTIELIKGGTESIIIQDNGLGMNEADAKLSIERHATSKITKLEDLFNIRTLGFRGEALASISAVAQFTLETNTSDSAEGTKLTLVDNHLNISPCGCPRGTKISIKDLFYNVPARKKFLKSPGTEYNHILELITNFALINPAVGFKLTHNNKLILNWPKTNDWLERVKQVLGTDIASNLLTINNQGSIQLTGFLGKPQIARQNRQAQFIFVNGRFINDFVIAKAVKEGYGTLIPKDLYPTFILHIVLDPSLVDVNVHPRKTEVKFVNSQEIYFTILQSVQKALVNNSLMHQIKTDGDLPTRKFTLRQPPTTSSYKPSISYQPSLRNIPAKPSAISKALEFSQQILQNEIIPTVETTVVGDWRLIGQIHNSYLLVEAPQGILIIDQHAAAERILYEKFKIEYEQKNHKAQKLLLPLTLELSANEVETLNQSREFLGQLGFEIEIFGSNTFIINAVPQILDKLDIKTTILGLISDLQDNDFSKAKSIDEKKDLVVKYTACRTAVKFHDQLSQNEQIKLLEDVLLLIEKINTCPHGRPFLMELTLNQLAKNFKRL